MDGPGHVNGVGTVTFLEPPLGYLDHPVQLTLSSDLLGSNHPKQLDEETNAFFSKVLNGDNMAKTVQDALIRGPPAHKKFIDNILKLLTEEVSIHLHEYPENMLYPICDLYGNLLAFGPQLFSKTALSVLWRAVLVALYNHPADSAHLVLNGMVRILTRAKHTLCHFSNLANCFENAALFSDFPVELKEYIKKAGACAVPLQSENVPFKPPKPPSENVSERVFFVFNNVSQMNVNEKSKELIELIDESVLPWFSYYFIGKRVTQEQKFHPIFAEVLEKMREKLPKVKDSVKIELFRNIKQILRDVRLDKEDLSQRNNLKALGNFLGLITLARNKPVLHDELCFKELIYEAYRKGPIPVRYVIPFVSSVLGHAINSKVFPPPNPWTVAILKVLREYHTLPNSQEKMRFDIELLFQKLEQKLENIQIATYLRDSNKTLDVQLIMIMNEASGQAQGNRPDSLAVSTSHAEQQQMLLEAVERPSQPSIGGSVLTPQGESDMPHFSQQNWAEQQRLAQQMNRQQQQAVSMQRPMLEGPREATSPSLPLPSYNDFSLQDVYKACNIDELLHINDQRLASVLGLFEKPDIRHAIKSAVEMALREFCNSIIERYHKITIPTVLTIVRKDFALDYDFARLRNAGAQMVRHLTASLALVSGREALTTLLTQRIGNSLFSILNARSCSHLPSTEEDRTNVNFITQAVVTRASGACLAYAQKYAADAILQNLDDQFHQDLKLRLELGPQAFVEKATSMVHSQQNSLPPKLRLTPGKPKDLDLMVYEEFRHSIPGFAPGTVPQPPRMTLPSNLQQRYQQMSQKLASIRLPQVSKPAVTPTTSAHPSGGQPPVSSSAPPSAHNTVFFDTLIDIFERHASEIRHHSACTPDDPILHSMSSLISIIQSAKNNYQPHISESMSMPNALSKELANNIVSSVVKSIFTHYRPSQRQAEVSSGGGIMQHFMEAVMTTLRQLQSQFPYAWITKQVTKAWIALSDLPEPSNELEAEPKTKIAIKWNWLAFIELLRVHIISLPDIDGYLAEQVLEGSEATINFVLDIMDNFILPVQPTLASHKSLQASLTSSANVHPLSMVPGANPLGPIGSSIVASGASNAMVSGSGSQTVSSGSSSGYKRQFTVLNEYDLWRTIEALRFCVVEIGSSSSGSSKLRLQITCARVRALLDLGLMETALLPSGPGQQQFRTLTSMGVAALYAGCSQAREFGDSLHMDAGVLITAMNRWNDAYHMSPHCNNVEAERLLNEFIETDLLSSESNLTSFCRTVTQGVIEKALNYLRHTQSKGLLQGQVHVNAYGELDAYSKLMACLIKRCGVKPTSPDYSVEQDIKMKIHMLNKILGLIAGMLLQENEVRRDMFHSMPFERIINMLFLELISPSTNPPLPEAAVGAGQNGLSSDVSHALAVLQNHIPIAFSHLLHILRPEKATMFVFSWLELIAHRHFITKTVACPDQSPEAVATNHSMYAQLLVDLLKYLSFFLQNALLPKPIQQLYRYTLRIFMIFLHDFPGFVCSYYSLFCDVIPTNTVQMRNIILSAVPSKSMSAKNMLQVAPMDQLASLDDPTGYCMSSGDRLPSYLKRELDNYILTREPSPMLVELPKRLRLTDEQELIQLSARGHKKSGDVDSGAVSRKMSDTGGDSDAASIASTNKKKKKHSQESSYGGDADKENEDEADENGDDLVLEADQLDDVSSLWSVKTVRQFASFGQADCMYYNTELISNMVIYLCCTSIKYLRSHNLPLNMDTIAGQPQMDILHGLVLGLDNEGRYLLLNCMANQLRYPNSHTFFFSFALLYLFSHQTATEAVKEQISRVLMERIIVSKPHPDGLLSTTSELLHNPAYGFWDHDFARSDQQIASILTEIAKSVNSGGKMRSAPVQNAGPMRPGAPSSMLSC